MNQNVTRCADKIKKVLSEDRINPIAEETGFNKRLRKLTPVRAIWAFVTGMGSGRIDTISDIVRLFGDLTGESMQYKPFHDRLSHNGFPEFFRQTLSSFMTGLSEPMLQSKSPYLKKFDDILMQDGSSFAVNDDLADHFPGRFTKVSPAAIEVHCTYSLYEGQAIAIGIAPDKESERDFLPDPKELKGKLLLGDRGYTSYKYTSLVKEEGGDFIGRMKDKKANPKIIKCYRGFCHKKGLEGKTLKEIDLPKCNVDLLIEGKDPNGKVHRVRLVLFYVKKKDCHIYLITTLSHEVFPPNIVASLYRLRWQVELFFKECKSYTNLQKFRTKNPHIVEGLVWASLLAVLIRRFLLYSAFRDTKTMAAPFIAAALSWTFFRELGKIGVDSFKGLTKTLTTTLKFLRDYAGRTNPRRIDTFDLLYIEPLLCYA